MSENSPGLSPKPVKSNLITPKPLSVNARLIFLTGRRSLLQVKQCAKIAYGVAYPQAVLTLPKDNYLLTLVFLI